VTVIVLLENRVSIDNLLQEARQPLVAFTTHVQVYLLESRHRVVRLLLGIPDRQSVG
jgi:hypothetical protein